MEWNVINPGGLHPGEAKMENPGQMPIQKAYENMGNIW